MPKQSLTKRSDGRYKVKYQEKQFYGKTQAEAIRKRDEYIRALRAGLQTTCPTVSSYAVAWLPIHKGTVAQNTYNAYAGALDVLIGMYGKLLLSEITPTMIKAVYSGHYARYSDSAIKKARSIYIAMFDSAVADGYIRINPARDKTAKPHKGTEGSHRALTPEEDAILLAVQHTFRPVVMAMRYAGLRRGEALALNVSTDVDFDNNLISVHNAVAFVGNQPVVKAPKTEAGRRVIPMLDILRQELQGIEGYVAKSKNSGDVMSEMAFKRAWESYILAAECHINNCPSKRWYGKTNEHKARLAAGEQLAPWKKFNIRPHDLRHSYCTMLRDCGLDMNIAVKWMGHEDEKMILEIYDHISPERERKATEMLEKHLGVQNGVQKCNNDGKILI